MPTTSEPTTITITHTHQEGTLIEGSRKGDGVYEIARAHGFRYFPSIRAIGIRGSRDKNAQRFRIEAVARALREAGFSVELDIDDQWRPAAEREADRAQRAEDRADRLAERAEKAQNRADAHQKAVDNALDRIPFGQPLLVDHYSYKAEVRRRERAWKHQDDAIREDNYAGELARRSDAATATQRHRENPRVTMRRLERLEAEQRRKRRHGRYNARLEEEIAHWKKYLADLAASGEFVAWAAEHFQKGDRVLIRGTWHPVVRVNRKTLTVESRFAVGYNGTAPYDEIGGRRRHDKQLDTPNGEEHTIKQLVPQP